jgi:prevent-host-death family protein
LSQLDQLDQLGRRAYVDSMKRTVNLYEAKTHLSALVDAAERGEEIVIAKNGVAKARLIPAGEPARERKPSGLLRIRHIVEDFDAPDAEIVRLFEGEA